MVEIDVPSSVKALLASITKENKLSEKARKNLKEILDQCRKTGGVGYHKSIDDNIVFVCTAKYIGLNLYNNYGDIIAKKTIRKSFDLLNNNEIIIAFERVPWTYNSENVRNKYANVEEDEED